MYFSKKKKQFLTQQLNVTQILKEVDEITGSAWRGVNIKNKAFTINGKMVMITINGNISKRFFRLLSCIISIKTWIFEEAMQHRRWFLRNYKSASTRSPLWAPASTGSIVFVPKINVGQLFTQCSVSGSSQVGQELIFGEDLYTWTYSAGAGWGGGCCEEWNLFLKENLFCFT